MYCFGGVSEYTERTEENIRELPKEIADEIINYVKQEENNNSLDGRNTSTERLCDYIALEYYPEYGHIGRYLSELRDRLIAASFDDIMALCGFLASRQKFFYRYRFPSILMVTGFLDRSDKEEFVKRFDEAGGFELLNLENSRERIVELSQNLE